MNNFNNKNFNSKVLFVAVDLQKDFVNPNGALYVPGSESIKGNVKTLSDIAFEYNIRIVKTKDSHDFDSEEFSSNPDFVNTFPVHCVEGTLGAELIEEVGSEGYFVDWRNKSPLDYSFLNSYREIIVGKDSFSFFSNPHADTLISKLNPQVFFVYGVATNFCVNDAVEGLVERYKGKSDVYVVMDAVKEIKNVEGYRSVEQTLQRWENFGVKRIFVSRVPDLLKKYL